MLVYHHSITDLFQFFPSSNNVISTAFGTAAASGLGTFGGGLLAVQSTGEAALGGLMSFGIGSILGAPLSISYS